MRGAGFVSSIDSSKASNCLLLLPENRKNFNAVRVISALRHQSDSCDLSVVMLCRLSLPLMCFTTGRHAVSRITA
jgi:hypothetical protein